MATSIYSDETGTPDTGTWVQASSSTNTMLRVESSDPDSAVAILISETSGSGVGSEAPELVVVFGTHVVYLPSGTYYINADIQRNDGTIDVVAQN